MHLDAEIRRLEAEFNMFFAGRLPRPPWETRARVAALVKKHDQSFIQNTADRFRFESLQNRYAKFIELWERQMTNRELGRPMSRRDEGGAHAGAEPAAPRRRSRGRSGGTAAARARRRPSASSSSARADDTSTRIVAREGVVRATRQRARNRSAKSRCRSSALPALVHAQVDKFGADGTTSRSRSAMKDGKVSLTVKAEKDKE